MRGESGVAGEGRVVGIPKFHSWGKFTMPLTNINTDWMSNASCAENWEDNSNKIKELENSKNLEHIS